MKINPIKNISNKVFQTNSGNLKRSLSYSKDTFELSFGTKIKHSSDFLNVTKECKDIRQNLTMICMLDEEDNFNSEYEKEFIEAQKIYKLDSVDEKTRLLFIALALKAKRTSGDFVSLTYFLGNELALLERGLSLKEIQEIFNWEEFDLNTPSAIAMLQSESDDQYKIADKKIFLSAYCKGENDLIDTHRVLDLVKMFKFFSVSEKEEADALFTFLLDKNAKYCPERYEFFMNSASKILNYAYKNDKNARIAFGRDENMMKNMIYFMLDDFMSSNLDEDGYFDISKAYESFDYWFDYVIQNQEELNNSLTIKIYDKTKQESKPLSLSEYVRKNPDKKLFMDNVVFKLSSIFSNSAENIQ